MLTLEELNRRTKSGMVALVGRANVGKSTLLNRLLEEKVSIVSDVAQTTRNLIRAVYTEPRGQLVFLDTPGVHKATHDLGRLMNRVAKAAVEGVDVVAMVLDASAQPYDEDDGWMRKIIKLDLPVLFILNKMDLGGAHADNYRALWGRRCADCQIDPASKPWLEISAADGSGVDTLINLLFELVPIGPPLFPDNVLTDFPRKLAIGDSVREKLFLELRDELPHAIAVSVTGIEESPGKWLVHADIYVNRPTQKGIVIGNKGRLLKKVQRLAATELSEQFGVEVELDLWVKIEKNWAKNFWILQQLGYA